MEYITASNIVAVMLAACILIFGLLTVTTTKILRAATYLFFVLFSIAGLYLLMSYEFLAAVQLSVYAGGIVILFVFAILLVKNLGEDRERVSTVKKVLGAVAACSGLVASIIAIMRHGFVSNFEFCTQIAESVNMELVGYTLMGTDQYNYLLPFEAASILLLACIIGSIVIAQKEKEVKQ